MAVMARETWTDERFTRVERDIDQFVLNMKEGFARVEKRLDRTDADVRELRGDIKGMQRLMIQGFFGMGTLTVTCFGILAGMIAF